MKRTSLQTINLTCKIGGSGMGLWVKI